MALERVYTVEDQERLVLGQDIDRHPPGLIVPVDNTNLQVWGVEVILTFEPIYPAS
jgi:hypothetical protein